MNQTPAGVKPAEVRAWAIANGFPELQGKNGRLPSRAIAAFMHQHPLAAIESIPPMEVQ